MKVIVSGGGTGGHIYPAISIANAFCKYVDDIEILYVGTKSGPESEIVPDSGYPFEGIEVKGFLRKITIENIKRIYLAWRATKDSMRIMNSFKPDIVIGTGGYVCGPVLRAAKKYGAFTAIHEQNSFPGLTNRILAKKADVVFLGSEKAREHFHTNKEVFFVGNPVRDRVFDLTRESARQLLDMTPDEIMILSVGGSGGAESLNDAFLGALPYLLEKNISFLHITGKVHYSYFMNCVKGYQFSKNQIFKPYEKDILLYMAAADLVVCSAGATTLAEVNAMGKASIVIPKSYTAENHQEYNAKFIKEKKAGEYILEKELNSQALVDKIMKIISNGPCRKEMERNSASMFPSNPAESIVKKIMEKLS